MALDQSALTDLLDALRSGGDLDFMREAVQLVLQALIDLEVTERIGPSIPAGVSLVWSHHTPRGWNP